MVGVIWHRLLLKLAAWRRHKCADAYFQLSVDDLDYYIHKKTPSYGVVSPGNPNHATLTVVFNMKVLYFR